ncbi:hypothetical protein NP233_g1588 [Leucocoprinus birnbaumii]|uniref:Uncharacterized protein n=1 Tax=Leucocoprinus birnbaumii TaxID=56174 RepID=A0AAD5YVN8_9AGAR|nr:hypothetical protein NP233_g1588 [Leucocoprinus birnbaumii]
MGSDPPLQSLKMSNSSPDTRANIGPSIFKEISQRPESPEPLSEEDIAHIRSRVVDMGFGSDWKSQNALSPGDLTLRENELGSMVVRLLGSFVDPVQLHRQAEFISWLGNQRDLLVQSFEEERKRWEAEREGWARMAEALLSQRAKAANSAQRDEELERQCSAYESENKSLREKLQDSHSRFSALESELSKLKPLLLMQPPLPQTISSSKRPPASQPDHLAEPGSSQMKRKAVESTLVGEPGRSSALSTPAKPTGTPQPHTQAHADSNQEQPRSDYYRRQSRSTFFTPLHSRMSSHSTPGRSIFSASHTPSTHHHSPKKSRSKHRRFLSSNLLPLAADARTEHLLLAARKLGRERASAASSLMRRVEKEREDLMREREAERLERERQDKTAAAAGANAYYRKDLLDLSGSPGSSAAPSMPKTPKRGTTSGQHSTHFLNSSLMTPRSDLPTSQTPNSFIFVRTPATTAYQTSMTPTPRATNHPPLPVQPTIKPTQTPTESSTSTSHPTPLASLLSAAKSMMDDESNEPKSQSSSRRRAGALEPPESPLPKRRKVSNGSLHNKKGFVDMLATGSTPSQDRVRSALDVLADQAAAAFDSDWRSPSKSPAKSTSKSRGPDKGKGTPRTRARAAVASEEETEPGTTPKGKGRATQDSYSSSILGSPLSTRSRSKGLLTDRLPKEPTKIPRQRKADKSTDLPSRNPPAPRMIFSPGTRESIPPLPSLSPALSPTPPAVAEPRNTAGPSTRPAAEDIGDDPHPSLNGTSSLRSQPPILSGSHVQADTRITPDSPTVDMEDRARVPQQHDTGTPSPNSQDTQADDEVLVVDHSAMTMTSVAESDERRHDPHEKPSSGDVPGGEEAARDMRDSVGVGSHASSSFMPDEDGHDTDADAEGEMDVDAEETVFIESSAMTHESLSLGLPQSQPGNAHTIAVVSSTNDDSQQCSGRP